MNQFYFVCLLVIVQRLALPARSGLPPLPITQSAEVAVVDSGIGDEPHFVYHVFARDTSKPPNAYFRVSFGLIPKNSAHPLRAKAKRIHFPSLEPIGAGNQDYRDDDGSDWLGWQVFDNTQRFAGASPWIYHNPLPDPLPGTFDAEVRKLTEFFVGYRFAAEDGNHFGWVKFTRSDTTFTNMFDLVAHDWNPIPGAPIQAGLPPEIPVATAVVTNEAGQPVLQASWHPALAIWRFETTADLTPPVEWIEYPSSATAAEILLDGADTHRYFRLRRP